MINNNKHNIFISSSNLGFSELIDNIKYFIKKNYNNKPKK